MPLRFPDAPPFALGKQQEELLSIIGDYEGLVVRSGVTVDEDLISAARQMRIIGRAGTGEAGRFARLVLECFSQPASQLLEKSQSGDFTKAPSCQRTRSLASFR